MVFRGRPTKVPPILGDAVSYFSVVVSFFSLSPRPAKPSVLSALSRKPVLPPLFFAALKLPFVAVPAVVAQVLQIGHLTVGNLLIGQVATGDAPTRR